MKDKQLNSYNVGGKHSQNPLGGIPLGVGANGKQNVVEQGETSYDSNSGKFIFSDSITVSKEAAKEFGLPKYTVGKTYAKASELINNKYNGRNDNSSNNTKEAFLDRARESQEYEKLQHNMATNAQEVPDMMNGQVPQGLNEFNEGGSIAGALGGGLDMINSLSGDGVSTNPAKAGLTGAAKGAMAGASFGPWGAAIGGVLGGASGLIGSSAAKRKITEEANINTQAGANTINKLSFGGPIGGGDKNIYNLGGLSEKLSINTDPDPKKKVAAPAYPSNPQDLIGSFQSNQEALNYKNPYPNRSSRWAVFDTYQKGLKNSSFGAATLSTPTKGRNAFTSDYGLTGPKLESELKIEELKKSRPAPKPYTYEDRAAEVSKALNKFNDGGYTVKAGDTMGGIAKANNIDLGVLAKLNPNVADMNKVNVGDNVNLEAKGLGLKSLPGSTVTANPAEGGIIDAKPSAVTPPKITLGDRLKGMFNRGKNWLNNEDEDGETGFNKIGDGLNTLGRLSPVISNLAQLKNLKKPEHERLDKLDNKYQKHQYDASRMQNTVTNQFNNTSEALANMAGGNTAQARAGVRSANYNKLLAMSDATAKQNQLEAGQDEVAQKFNLGVGTTNLQQSNRERDINAQNKAAYDSAKSALISGTTENLAAIGKENQQMDQVAKMYGYTWDGKYIRDKKGNIIDPTKLPKTAKDLEIPTVG